MTHAQPVVQYGYRDDDDDDDDDSDDERRRQGFFGGVLQRQRNGSANKRPAGLEVMSKLGASFSNSMNNFEKDDDGGGDEYDNDSDDGSVSSKASVASKASQTLMKLGGKLGFKKKNRRASDSESYEDDSSDEDGGMDDRSVSARIKKVTGKLSNALKVGGRRKSTSDGEESDSEDEEDILSPNTKRASNPFFRRSTGNNRFGRDHATRPLHDGSSMRRCKTDSEENAKSALFRRAQTAEAQVRKSITNIPKEALPTHTKVRRSKSDSRAKTTATASISAKSRSKSPQEEDGHVSDLSVSDSESGHAVFNPQAQYGNNPVRTSATASSKIPGSEAWSMNITEEMWEEITSDVEDDTSISRKKGWKMNVPKQLLVDLPKNSPNQTQRNLRA